MNELKKNNILISTFLVFVLILGKGFHFYFELKKENEKKVNSVFNIEKKYFRELLRAVENKDLILMNENIKPFIDLPFVKGLSVRGKKGDIIRATYKSNTNKKIVFLEIPLKKKENI